VPTWVEDKEMHLQRQWWSGLVAAVLGGLVGVTAVAAGSDERTGLYDCVGGAAWRRSGREMCC
jgi:hypothetical protein